MANEYRIHGLYRETLLENQGSLNFYGLYRETVISPPANVQIYGLTRETLHTGSSNAEVRVNQIVVEVLRSRTLSASRRRMLVSS